MRTEKVRLGQVLSISPSTDYPEISQEGHGLKKEEKKTRERGNNKKCFLAPSKVRDFLLHNNGRL